MFEVWSSVAGEEDHIGYSEDRVYPFPTSNNPEHGHVTYKCRRGGGQDWGKPGSSCPGFPNMVNLASIEIVASQDLRRQPPHAFMQQRRVVIPRCHAMAPYMTRSQLMIETMRMTSNCGQHINAAPCWTINLLGNMIQFLFERLDQPIKQSGTL